MLGRTLGGPECKGSSHWKMRPIRDRAARNGPNGGCFGCSIGAKALGDARCFPPLRGDVPPKRSASESRGAGRALLRRPEMGAPVRFDEIGSILLQLRVKYIFLVPTREPKSYHLVPNCFVVSFLNRFEFFGFACLNHDFIWIAFLVWTENWNYSIYLFCEIRFKR